MWAMTHPLSPLRVKAMQLFWQSETAKSMLPNAPGGHSGQACDKEITQLLAYMDPRARRTESGIDPLLEPFLTWGSLVVAASDNRIHLTELKALVSVVGKGNVERALSEPRNVPHYQKRFKEALDRAGTRFRRSMSIEFSLA